MRNNNALILDQVAIANHRKSNSNQYFPTSFYSSEARKYTKPFIYRSIKQGNNHSN